LSAAEVLSKAGFEQVSALRGGMESWNKAGYPSKGIRPGIVNDHQSTNRSPYRFYPQTDEMASMLGRVKEAKGFAARSLRRSRLFQPVGVAARPNRLTRDTNQAPHQFFDP
jgi:3-mercaptopyruvate sulfurtransferase SseA